VRNAGVAELADALDSKSLSILREQLGHCHLPTSGRLIERAHEVLTQAAGDSKPGEAAKLFMPSARDWQRER